MSEDDNSQRLRAYTYVIVRAMLYYKEISVRIEYTAYKMAEFYLVVGHLEAGLHASNPSICDVTPVLRSR